MTTTAVAPVESDYEHYCRLFARLHGEAVIAGTLAALLPKRRESFRRDLASCIWEALEEYGMKPKVGVTLTVKCVKCGEKRTIKPGEIAAWDFPMCPKDGIPMMPEKADAKLR